VTNYPGNTVTILLGKGDDKVQPATAYAVGTTPISIAVADFNGDGRLDLAGACYYSNGLTVSDSISILLGDGDGAFQAGHNTAFGLSPSFPRPERSPVAASRIWQW
jgi:FG-GAP-like repeat